MKLNPNILGIYAKCEKCMTGKLINDLLDTSWDDRSVFLECKECNPKEFEALDYIGNFCEEFLC